MPAGFEVMGKRADTHPDGPVQNPPFLIYIAFLFLLICINSLVGKFVVFTFEFAPGVSAYYLVVVVMIAFTLWFGMWGAIAAYIGCFIGAGLLSSIPPSIGVFWSLADFWQVLIPFLACRSFRVDISLKTRRDLVMILLFGGVINNLLGAAWGSVSLALGGMIPWSGLFPTFYAWFIGNAVICLVLLPPLLRLMTPRIRQHELFVRGYWR